MKVAMVFSGYGSQFVGMAKELYDESRLIQEYFEEASNCLNINFVKLCFASSENELSKIDNAYESIFLVSSAIAALLAQEGINSDIVAGYGLGEYSAICVAGGLSLPDGLYFLSKYAQIYQEFLDNFELRSIKVNNFSIESVEKLCANISTQKNQVSLAVYLAHDTCIVTGGSAAVTQAQEEAVEKGAKVEDVPLETGLHSSLMNPVVEQLAIYLEKIDFNNLKVPLIASLDGKIINKGEQIKEHIMKKINSAVRWDKVIKELGKYEVILVIGPGCQVSEELVHYYPKKKIISINKRIDIDLVKSSSQKTIQK